MPFWIRIALLAAVGTLLAVSALAQARSSASRKPPSLTPEPPAPGADRDTPLDINTASEAELDALPGIGKAYAQAIIKGRPYASKHDLRTKKIIPERVYNDVEDRIVARRL